MTSLTEHQILVFFVQLLVLFVAARGLGAAMRRVGQPAVVGELAAGLLIGPSVLGRLWPSGFQWLFPPEDVVQTVLLLAISWLGVALLLVVTGFETDLTLLRSLGRSSMLVAVGSIVVPLVASFFLGFLLPESFVGSDATRSTFSMFIAVSLSISALAVIGKILGDLRLMRRNVGQVSLAAAVANDMTGWVLLGAVAGIVHDGDFRLVGLLVTVGAIVAYLAFAFTWGQRLTDGALRRVRESGGGSASAISVHLAVALASGIVTAVIGVEAVLGAFIAGIVLARSRYQQEDTRLAIEHVTGSFFAPIFFATAGLRVDLGLLQGSALAWTAGAIAVAMVAKSLGAFLGGLAGGLPGRENLAVAVGLNARGTLEIVVATVALGLNIFTNVSYTAVIVLAMTTSLITPPLLRRVLAGLTAGPEEAARLEREAVLDTSVVASTRTALLPTRGGSNSLLAARLLDLSLQHDTNVVVFTVTPEGNDEARRLADAAAAETTEVFEDRGTERIGKTGTDAGRAICAEATLGYGLVALGLTEGFSGADTVSPVLRDVLAGCPVPILLVKKGRDLDPHVPDLPINRIMVPATGTKVGQAAQEVAYTLAARVDATVDVVHVVSRPDKVPEPVVAPTGNPPDDSVSGMLDEARELAGKFGRSVTSHKRMGPSVGMELALTADETAADLLVLGATVRSYSGRPFLGHGVEYLLEHAEQTVLVVVFPAGAAEPAPPE